MATRMNKKRKIFAAVCILLSATVAALLIAKHLSGDKVYALSETGAANAEQITLISHRGMTVDAPENTLEAAEEAARYGYTQVEFDIRQTKDGVWVLMHDEDIKGTTNGKGKVSELTLKQLFEFRVKKGKVSSCIPTLNQMLNKCGELGLHPVIEIKQSGTEFIEDLVRSIGYLVNDCTIITFNREQAELSYGVLSEGTSVLTPQNAQIYWLTSDLSDETFETAKTTPEIGVSFNGNKAGSPEEIQKFSRAGIPLATWTINSPERLAELSSLGITTFTTDKIAPLATPEEQTDEVTTNGRY